NCGIFVNQDHKYRIDARKPGRRSPAADPAPAPAEHPRRPAFVPALTRPTIEPDPQKDAERQLLARYAPPAVIVDNDLNIVQFRGDTAPYLIPRQGNANLNLLKMLREGLLVAVRGWVQRTRREK